MYRLLLNSNKDLPVKSVVTIGNFDGVHIGHLHLFNALAQIGQKNNLKKIIITFEPYPNDYFADKNNVVRPTRLSLLRDKYLELSNLGYVDELLILRFNANICSYEANKFIQEILINALNTTTVVVGHDFRFGYQAKGTINDFFKHKLHVFEVPAFKVGSQRVSSSLIREYAKNNDLINVKKFLGHNLHYTSRIIYGNQLGKKYNVPTINLSLGRNRPALWGIYVAYVFIDKIKYKAVASIGKNPTTSDIDTYKLEAHLLDVDLNLYGKIATIEILEFLRCEQKFIDLKSLFNQIRLDILKAREYFTINT